MAFLNAVFFECDGIYFFDKSEKLILEEFRALLFPLHHMKSFLNVLFMLFLNLVEEIVEVVSKNKLFIALVGSHFYILDGFVL